MMRTATTQAYDAAISAFNVQQTKVYNTQQQISTGLAVRDPHQDPVAAVTIERLENLDSRLESYQRNADALENQLSLEDVSLGDMMTVFQRLRELTVQAGDPTLPPVGREAVATELREGLKSLAGIANTVNSQGHYAFAGAQGAQKPVELDEFGGLISAQISGDGTPRSLAVGESRQMTFGTTSVAQTLRAPSDNALRTRADLANTGGARLVSAFVNDETAYAGGEFSLVFSAPDTFDVVDGTGTVIAAGETYEPGKPIRVNGVTLALEGGVATGDEFHVEPGTSKDAFTMVNQLVDALLAGTPDQLSDSVSTTLDDLDALQESLSLAQVTVGSRLNSLDAQQRNNEDMRFQLEKTLSVTRDTDYVSAIADLQQQMMVLEAAQASFARIEQTTLFDLI